MPEIIDGNLIAKQIHAELKAKLEKYMQMMEQVKNRLAQLGAAEK